MSAVPGECLSWEWHLACIAEAKLAGWLDGNKCGLDAAIDAVVSLRTGWTAADDRDPYWLISKTDAREAIEALRQD